MRPAVVLRRMFDEGLWSVDDQLRIIVAKDRFTEQGPRPCTYTPSPAAISSLTPPPNSAPLDFIRQHRQFHGFAGG